jgi:hypothetical protein
MGQCSFGERVCGEPRMSSGWEAKSSRRRRRGLSTRTYFVRSRCGELVCFVLGRRGGDGSERGGSVTCAGGSVTSVLMRSVGSRVSCMLTVGLNPRLPYSGVRGGLASLGSCVMSRIRPARPRP